MDVIKLTITLKMQKDKLIELKNSSDQWSHRFLLSLVCWGFLLTVLILNFEHYTNYLSSLFAMYNSEDIYELTLTMSDTTLVLTVIVFSLLIWLFSGIASTAKSKYDNLRSIVIKKIDNDFCNCKDDCLCKDEFIKEMLEIYDIDLAIEPLEEKRKERKSSSCL